MSAAAVIADARADGVLVALSASGTLKAIGDGAAVNRWLAVIREHKAEIIEVLKVRAERATTSSRCWLLHFADRDSLEVWTAPPATHAEILASYPDALAAEPIPDAIEESPAAVAQSCRACRHLKRPGHADGYCAKRVDLPAAYSEHHPLRRLPDDGGADCKHFEAWT